PEPCVVKPCQKPVRVNGSIPTPLIAWAQEDTGGDGMWPLLCDFEATCAISILRCRSACFELQENYLSLANWTRGRRLRPRRFASGLTSISPCRGWDLG